MSKTPLPARSAGGVTTFAIVIVLGVILVYMALFVYQSILNNDIDSLAASLDRAKGAFETNLITELQTIDARLLAGGTLLKRHTALSPLFGLLEENTVQTLRYKSFSLKTESDGIYSVSLRGEADDYASIALQSDIFSQNKYIKDYIFSNLTLNQDGRIVFDFNAKINPSLFSYGQIISTR